MVILGILWAILIDVWIYGSPVFGFLTVYLPRLSNFFDGISSSLSYGLSLIWWSGTIMFFTIGTYPLSLTLKTNLFLDDLDTSGMVLGFFYSLGYLFLISELGNYYKVKRENKFNERLLEREKRIENANKIERQRIILSDEADFSAYEKIFNIEQPILRKKWGRYMSYDDYLNFSLIYHLRENNPIYIEELEKVITNKLNHIQPDSSKKTNN